MQAIKKCSQCDLVVYTQEDVEKFFSKHPYTKDGRCSACKACQKKKYQPKSKERSNNGIDWLINRPGILKELMTIYEETHSLRIVGEKIGQRHRPNKKPYTQTFMSQLFRKLKIPVGGKGRKAPGLLDARISPKLLEQNQIAGVDTFLCELYHCRLTVDACLRRQQGCGNSNNLFRLGQFGNRCRSECKNR